MPFNVAKQPLIPAFLSLFLFVVVALCYTTESLVAVDLRHGLTPEQLPIPSFGVWLAQFQAAHPLLAHLIGGFLMLYTGTSLGRLTVRYNLYGTGTCLAIPIYGLAMIGVMQSGGYLTAIVVSMLLMLAVKNYCFSYRNGFGFDRIFRGGIFLTLLIWIEPAAAPLLLLLPIVARRFRRTSREMIVALCGVLLPILTICYLNWALGGELIAPLRMWYRALTTGAWGDAVLHVSLKEQLFCGVMILLTLMGLALFSTNSYNVNTKARHIFQLCGRMLLLTLASLALPAASEATLALVSIPVTLLLPVLFIRIHRPIAQTLYPILIAGAVASLLC